MHAEPVESKLVPTAHVLQALFFVGKVEVVRKRRRGEEEKRRRRTRDGGCQI